MAQLQINLRTPSKKTLILGWTLVATGIVVGTGAWLILRPTLVKPLLPKSITSQITGFTPYFYNEAVPAKYSFNPKAVQYNSGVLIIQLTKPGSPDVTLTQQALPAKLSPTTLLEKGTKLTTLAGSATVNSVEGRLLATIVSSSKPQTLILINTAETTSKTDVTALAQSLQPQH